VPRILRWGYKNRIPPLFQMWGTSKQISVGAIEYSEICCLVVTLINIGRPRRMVLWIRVDHVTCPGQKFPWDECWLLRLSGISNKGSRGPPPCCRCGDPEAASRLEATVRMTYAHLASCSGGRPWPTEHRPCICLSKWVLKT